MRRESSLENGLLVAKQYWRYQRINVQDKRTKSELAQPEGIISRLTDCFQAARLIYRHCPGGFLREMRDVFLTHLVIPLLIIFSRANRKQWNLDDVHHRQLMRGVCLPGLLPAEQLFCSCDYIKTTDAARRRTLARSLIDIN